MFDPLRQEMEQTPAEAQSEALRRRHKAMRFRIHFACGALVGAIAGFYFWTELPSPSIPEGFEPNPVERLFMALDSRTGVLVMVAGTALIGALLAAVKNDHFWMPLLERLKREGERWRRS
jgi:hypothetical protein